MDERTFLLQRIKRSLVGFYQREILAGTKLKKVDGPESNKKESFEILVRTMRNSLVKGFKLYNGRVELVFKKLIQKKGGDQVFKKLIHRGREGKRNTNRN